MMAEYFIKQVWKERKNDLLALSEEITQYYKEDSKNHTENNIDFINGQIDKINKKKTNLIDMFADAQITKEEYSNMRAAYETEIKALEEQKADISEQNEKYSRALEDLNKINIALAELTDFSDLKLRDRFLDKFLVSVVPSENKFYWNYRLTESKEDTQAMSVVGNKKHPTVIIDPKKEEASDEDASDIHNNENEVVHYFAPEDDGDVETPTHKEQLHSV